MLLVFFLLKSVKEPARSGVETVVPVVRCVARVKIGVVTGKAGRVMDDLTSIIRCEMRGSIYRVCTANKAKTRPAIRGSSRLDNINIITDLMPFLVWPTVRIKSIRTMRRHRPCKQGAIAVRPCAGCWTAASRNIHDRP